MPGRGLQNFVALALLGLTLSACASPSPASLVANDPFETLNREQLARNQWMDRNFFLPSARLYLAIVPEPARDGLRNIATNIDLPVIFINDMLQGEARRAKETAMRFTVNSTLGLGGIFDVASRWDLPAHREDFGQTLAVWGVGEGPYLVLPLLGPNNPRDAAGLATDLLINPFNLVPFKQHLWWEIGRNSFKILDLRAQNIKTLDAFERSSVDYYTSMRSLYRQLRQAEIRNGQPDPDMPDY